MGNEGQDGGGGTTEPPSRRFPSGFVRRDGQLACEGVPLAAIAAAAGTPAYIYSANLVRDQYHRLTSALAAVPMRVHYSVKANASHAVLSLLQALGAGVDIVSGGELYRALRAGMTGADVVFSGVGKTDVEMREALRARVLVVNVESEGELRLLSRVAAELGVTAPVALRVNPEVTVDTPHPYTRTGEKGMKFGIPADEAVSVGRLALSLPGVRLVGLDMHIGSQVAQVEPYRRGLEILLAMVAELRAAGADGLRYLDVGGGLAVSYEQGADADVEAFARAIADLVRPTGLQLIVEPGRYLVGNAGALLTRVLYRKRSGGKEFVITDAGMNDLLRPSHYHAYHRIDTVAPGSGNVVADVVGPVCESGDFLALDRALPDVAPGDLLTVHSAGAYGFSMASTYNSRPRPAEVLVDGDQFAIVTARERHEDLVRQEILSPDWRRV